MWVTFAVVAWAATLLACGRLCLVAAAAARRPGAGRQHAPAPPGVGLSLHETAFLAAGPRRVVDVTLVALARERRLLLAHTGWATVVDPEGRDPVERAVIAAAGAGGQSRITPLRATAARAPAMAALDGRLAHAGLAVPRPVRTAVAAALRQVRAAGVLVVAAGAATLLLQPSHGQPVAGWFVLPLLLIGGCLTFARLEIGDYTRWATPAGRQLLACADESEPLLTALAVRGPSALQDPELRAALTT